MLFAAVTETPSSLHIPLIKSLFPAVQASAQGSSRGWRQGWSAQALLSVSGHLRTISKHSYLSRLRGDAVVVWREDGFGSGTVRETEKLQPWKRRTPEEESLVGPGTGLKREEVEWPGGKSTGGRTGPGEAGRSLWLASLTGYSRARASDQRKPHSSLAGPHEPRVCGGGGV